ncbi:hypothetical protein BKM17_20515 [Pseudomonas syringae group genomosp. 3]|nr:hypothetical protein BKM17_20515 [Pseudomonas syringae group genomosp. 3]
MGQLWQVPGTFPCLNGGFSDLSGWVVEMWIRFRFYFEALRDAGNSMGGRLITDAIGCVGADIDHSFVYTGSQSVTPKSTAAARTSKIIHFAFSQKSVGTVVI